jgi:hypothetical protein
MKLISLFFLLIINIFFLTLLSSCAHHFGIVQGSAALSKANFKYVEQNVSGIAEAHYIFGLGGLKKQTLVQEAKRNLMDIYPIGENQALVNISVNWKTSFFLPYYYKTKCTVSADIVEFDKE